MSVEMHVPVIVTDGGPWAMHDMACARCTQASAVLDLDTGMFLPCWTCQQEGWKLLRKRTIRQRFRAWRGTHSDDAQTEAP